MYKKCIGQVHTKNRDTYVLIRKKRCFLKDTEFKNYFLNGKIF